MYYFEAIKRLQNSLLFRRVKLDHWSLFGLVTWVQTMGLRVWNSRWRPLLICLLITLSLKGLTQIHHACFLSMYFLLLSSISICRVEMIHWKYFQSVAFLSRRSWWLKPWHGLQKDDLMIFVFLLPKSTRSQNVYSAYWYFYIHLYCFNTFILWKTIHTIQYWHYMATYHIISVREYHNWWTYFDGE